MHKWLPNLVAKFWLPNLVLYQTAVCPSQFLDKPLIGDWSDFKLDGAAIMGLLRHENFWSCSIEFRPFPGWISHLWDRVLTWWIHASWDSPWTHNDLLVIVSVGKKRRTHRTFPMARPKCLMGDFTNFYGIYKAHQTNVRWTIKVFRLHCIVLIRCWFLGLELSRAAEIHFRPED